MPTQKINRFALALTALNLVAMLAFWSQVQVTSAQAVPDVLRAKGLQIVDDRGMVRAQIIVQPGGNTVLFRLIDQNQKPLVKLGAGADGSGLMLTGDPATQEWSGIQLLAKPAGTTVRLLNLDGKERVIKPE
ncbi:MAG TPA: hypothetical protein VN700_00255 [Vicinamibacterales bacterium]|nr:hypothetical protein [Vicinamibacterales bacterium]